MAKLLGFLTTNWQLKLLALALAVLLWVVVSADQLRTEWITVPVEVELGDESYALVSGPVPAEVKVRVSGRGREFWGLALNPPRLRLAVDQVSPDTALFALTPGMVELGPGRAAESIEVRPGTVRLSFQPVESRLVAVRFRAGEGMGESYVLAGPVRIRPERVRLVGPSGQLGRIESVPTLPLQLSPSDTVFSRLVGLDPDALGELRAFPPEVEVSGRVDPVVERDFRVPVTFSGEAEPEPATVTVRARGALSDLAEFSTSGVRAVVVEDSVPRSLPLGGYSVPIRLEGVPAGLVVTVTPSQVELQRGVRERAAGDTAGPPPDTGRAGANEG
ncbi:MAG: hypothetical protein ACREKN_01855 [Longimicrobiaceae bacterium]